MPSKLLGPDNPGRNSKPLTDLHGRPPISKGIRRCVHITEGEDEYLKFIGLGSRSLGLREAVRLLKDVYKHTQ